MKHIILICFLSIIYNTQSQTPPCYFDSLMLLDTSSFKAHYKNQMSIRGAFPPEIIFENAINKKRSSTSQARYIIPIVVHVIYSNSNNNISEAQIKSQIDTLNKAMRDPDNGIQFCFATKDQNGNSFNGIKRYNTGSTIKAYTNEGGLGHLMTTYQFDPDKYLNIFIVPAIYNYPNTESSAKGIGIPRTYKPDHPGIIVRYDYFGSFYGFGGTSLDSASDGKVLVHEAGHFLGLFHTFQGGCSGLTSIDCANEGDLCCDTKAENGPHWYCSNDINTCTDSPEGNDPIYNFMSYRDCWNEFTSDQKILMLATIQSSYPMLSEASNLIETGANGCQYHTALFSVNRNTVCDTGTFFFTALDSLNRAFEWKVINSLGNTEKYELSNKSTFTFKAMYQDIFTVILTTYENSQEITYTRKDFIRSLNCKVHINSQNGNWYFGKMAGINFTKGAPIIDNNARTGGISGSASINTQSYSTCQSTPNGRLLYYGSHKSFNKMAIFNKNHLPLTYGDSVYFGTGHGLLSIPVPGQYGRKFYIVTSSSGYQTGFPTDKTKALLWSLLDTLASSGLGAIDLTKRNQVVSPPPGYSSIATYPGNSALWATENLIAIPMCGSQNYWLITGANVNNGSPTFEGKLLVYSVTNTGIYFDHIDSFNVVNFRNSNHGIASSNGRWLFINGSLFSFDRSNGRISFIKKFSNVGPDYMFSANSSVLYYWDEINKVIKQIDLLNELRPANSIYLPYNTFKPMQLGPDGKIYIGNYGRVFLSVINNPDKVNSANNLNNCGFYYKGFTTFENGQGGTFNGGLPNIIHAKHEDSMDAKIIAIKSSCFTMKYTSSKCCQGLYNWDYGDASNGSGLEVQHTYSKGSYTVKLYINSILVDTLNIKIGLDTSDGSIGGSFNICDTLTRENYSSKNFNADWTYEWTAENGSIVSPNGDRNIEVLWNGLGKKFINLKVSAWGCTQIQRDTILLRPQVSNNRISMKNKYCGTDTIFGTTPTGGNGNYKYYWRKRRIGSQNWIEVSTPTNSINLVPDNESEAFEYFRFVYSNDNGSGHGCYYISNVIRITPFSNLNKIENNSSLCGIVSLGSNLDSITGINYQWQRSNDGNSWSDVSGQTSKNINNSSSLGSFYYYRRKVFTTTCSNYSNIIFAGGNKVIGQPINLTSCIGQLGNYKFKFTLANANDTNLSYIWEYKLPNNNSFTITGDTLKELTALRAYEISNIKGTYYRCQIKTGCGTIWTTGAKLFISSSIDTILIQPNKSYTLNQGNNLNLVCKITRDSLQKYQWQSSHNYGLDWFDMFGRTSDTLKLNGVNYCQNQKTYRLKITTNCNNIYYSDTSHVKVNNLTNNNQDYWMKDQWLDNGIEKNTRPERVVLSPDIFVSNSILTKKPPVLAYKPNIQEKNNYVHAMVRNRGSAAATGGKLYLYWTLAATGEKWPLNWINTKYNQHLNVDSIGNKNQGYFPMGSQINSSPILLPNINPGDSIIIPYLWSNIPNPDWYYPITPRGRIKEKEVNICLLGRIETCEESSFGMEFPEVISTHGNAANNNNIATRNLWVVYLFPEPNSGGQKGGKDDFNEEFKMHIGARPLIGGGLTWVKDLIGAPQFRNICINVSSSSFLNKADAYISLNDKILTTWINGGSLSSGLERLGSNIFRVTSTNACFENILIDSGFSDGFFTYFAYKDINNRFNNDEKFNLFIDQLDTTNLLEGSVGYEIRDNLFAKPILIENIEFGSACNWDGSGGVFNYSVRYPNLPYSIINLNTNDTLDKNDSGIYKLVPSSYSVIINDEPYNIIYLTTLNVLSSYPTQINSIDTVWYNCDYPDSVDYVKSCENGVMYDRFDQVVNESSAGHYTLDPQEPYYTFVCADSTNCTKYSTQIKFMDIIQIPSSTSNNLTGMYNREENPCCFIDLTEAECDGETPLTFGQEIQVYDMNADFLYQTNLELYGGTVLGFRFCPPQWDTASNVINNWYSIVIRNDECSFCRMDFMCDSISDPEPFVILNYPSGKPKDNLGLFEGKSANKGPVTKLVKPQKLPPSISIYPNPTQSEVNVKIVSVNSASITVNITDMAGKSVCKNSYKTTNNQLTTSINLSELVSGIYTVYVPELNYYYKLVIIK